MAPIVAALIPYIVPAIRAVVAAGGGAAAATAQSAPISPSVSPDVQMWGGIIAAILALIWDGVQRQRAAKKLQEAKAPVEERVIGP